MTGIGEVAVVGGGITGLAAAWELSGPADGERPGRVTVLEAGGRLGGKIDTTDVAGRTVEAGPDAFIARVPDAVALVEELGLGEELVAPATTTALIWSRGRLRRLPEDTVLGVPTRLRTLAASRIVSPSGLARAALDLFLPADTSTDDRSIAALIDARLGREVRERLVDPLLGGIHAGSTEHLSLAATAPQLDVARCEHRSLLRGLRPSGGPAPAATQSPLFLTLAGGLGRLVTELAGRLDGRAVELRTSAPVEKIERSGGRWQLATPQGPVQADAVVLAVPSFVAADLLAPHLPAVASELDAIGYASVVLVTLAYPAGVVSMPPDVSGFLVPRVEGRLMTACTWLSAKWPHMAAGQTLLRVSAGRWGDDRALELADDELVSRLRSELEDTMGLGARPDAAAVGRWPRAFPQYEVGHMERVARIRAALARQPGIALAGASYDGVGIPACIGQGRRAGRALLDRPEPGAER